LLLDQILLRLHLYRLIRGKTSRLHRLGLLDRLLRSCWQVVAAYDEVVNVNLHKAGRLLATLLLRVAGSNLYLLLGLRVAHHDCHLVLLGHNYRSGSWRPCQLLLRGLTHWLRSTLGRLYEVPRNNQLLLGFLKRLSRIGFEQIVVNYLGSIRCGCDLHLRYLLAGLKLFVKRLYL
jgi:hypothetical protein